MKAGGEHCGDHAAVQPTVGNEAEVACVLLAPAAPGRRLQPVQQLGQLGAALRRSDLHRLDALRRRRHKDRRVVAASQQALDHLEGLLGELFTLRRIQVKRQ